MNGVCAALLFGGLGMGAVGAAMAGRPRKWLWGLAATLLLAYLVVGFGVAVLRGPEPGPVYDDVPPPTSQR